MDEINLVSKISSTRLSKQKILICGLGLKIVGNCSKAVQAIIHLIERGPLSPFIYKYQKVAKPKLRFEEGRLVHELSLWGTSVVEVLFLKWEKAVKQDKWYAGQSLQDYELVFR
ncbi:hypothetical protein L1D41_14355 [Vibrio harveyi]|uniref:hypothetical protein n=1 Tax=Vibrio harveyi TaxID=669 RepID=UPI001EFD05AC|nr:hypothetical protein [Vibrio harveyi]MCG9610844.1 hypothetical protein [Vibrio harveyi]MCG9669248.1 hypothetical protein [Vibrio harveyi]